jgi:hypothetical protein
LNEISYGLADVSIVIDDKYGSGSVAGFDCQLHLSQKAWVKGKSGRHQKNQISPNLPPAAEIDRRIDKPTFFRRLATEALKIQSGLTVDAIA